MISPTKACEARAELYNDNVKSLHLSLQIKVYRSIDGYHITMDRAEFS